MTLDAIFPVCGVAEEAALVVLLARMRAFRRLPAFFLYICWSLAGDLLVLASQHLASTAFLRVYEATTIIDLATMFALLVELAWKPFSRMRESLPRTAWMGIAMLIAIAGALLWPLARLTVPFELSVESARLLCLINNMALLRVVVLLGIATMSRLLSIGWRDFELQVAGGLGLFSMLSLAALVIRMHSISSSRIHWADLLESAAYLLTLAYWLVCSAKASAGVKPRSIPASPSA